MVPPSLCEASQKDPAGRGRETSAGGRAAVDEGPAKLAPDSPPGARKWERVGGRIHLGPQNPASPHRKAPMAPILVPIRVWRGRTSSPEQHPPPPPDLLGPCLRSDSQVLTLYTESPGSCRKRDSWAPQGCTDITRHESELAQAVSTLHAFTT